MRTTDLNLTNVSLTNHSIRELEKISTLEKLIIDEDISLDKNSMKSLSNLINLRELYLRGITISDNALSLLAQNSNLKKLWLINCDFNEHDFRHCIIKMVKLTMSQIVV